MKSGVISDQKFPSADWVIELGPQLYTKDAICSPCYEYAVVSFAAKAHKIRAVALYRFHRDPDAISLFVLARDPETYIEFYNTTVYETLQTLVRCLCVHA